MNGSRDLPDALDPGNASYGYSTRGWAVSRISGSGLGQPAWTLTLRPPRGQSGSEPDLGVLPQYGYTTVTGGSRGQYITVVSAKGQAGPGCVLPPFTATDRPVDLLPHAGVVVIGNPPELCDPNGQLVVSFSEDGRIVMLSAAPAYTRNIAIPSGDASVAISSSIAYVRQDQAGAPVYGYDLATGERLWTVRSPRTPADAILYAFDGGFELQAETAGAMYR